MNPYVPLILLLLIGGAGAGGFWFGRDYQQGIYAQDELAREEATKAALDAVAESLAKIKVVQRTNNITLEKEIQKETFYQECRHTPEALKTINKALVPEVAK